MFWLLRHFQHPFGAPEASGRATPIGRVNCLECHENVSTGAMKPYGVFCHSRVFIPDTHGTYASAVAEPLHRVPCPGVLPDVPRPGRKR